jgi:hypothetical protein
MIGERTWPNFARQAKSANERGGEGNAMIVVVEITNIKGHRATKEYDAPSLQSAMQAVDRELQAYPQFRITDVWTKGERYLRELDGW